MWRSGYPTTSWATDERDPRSGRRRHLHRLLPGGRGDRRDAHAQGCLHARRSLARDPAGAARACAQGRPRLSRPRHHGGDQRLDPAARRQGRARHHRRLQGPAGDRPPDAAQDLRLEGRPPRGARTARAPLRGRRAHRPSGRGHPGARRYRHSASRSRRERERGRERGRLLSLLVPQSGARAAHGRGAAGGAARHRRVALLRGPARVPRVRAAFHHRAQRLPAAGRRPIHDQARGGGRTAGAGRSHRHLPVLGRAHVGRPGRRDADPHRALGARRRAS